ncbi:hypothetical protein ACK83H_004864, partial [Salmonella enterica]|nr:hypothetical protein [Salmonella enterica]EHF8124827.1 hypothetical protein [Salmonella enterica]EHJ6152950.1 hypothetical protein [Salmonella enterica]
METKRYKLTIPPLLVMNLFVVNFSYGIELPGICYEDSTHGQFRCGTASAVHGNNTIAIGKNSSTSGSRAIAIGIPDNGSGTEIITSSAEDGIAIGAGATVSDNAPGGVAIGSRRHNAAGIVLGDKVNSGAKVNSINGIAIGPGARSGAAGKSSFRNIAIGDLAAVLGNSNVGLGPGLVIGDDSDNSIAMGFGAAVGRLSPGNKAFGDTSRASALGYAAEVMKGSDRSTSLGSQSRVLQGATQSIALGNNTTINTGGNNSTAIGSFASVGTNAINAIAIGGGSKEENAAKANAVAAVAVGHASKAFGANALALGSNSYADAEGAVIIGSGAKNTKDTLTGVGLPADDGMNAIGIGSSVKSAANGIAIGREAEAKISEATTIAIGNGAVSAGGIAIGQGASVVKGNNPSGTASASVSVGRQTVVADYGVALGSRASVGITLTDDGNPERVTSGGLYGTAVGINSGVYSNSALAVGHNAKVSENANAALAIGYNSLSSAQNAIAIGKGAKASAENTISIGTGNIVSGTNSGALGDPSTVSGVNSYSIGNNNIISASNAFVLGNAVNNAVDNSVVLGNNSAVSAAIATPGYSVNGVSHKFAGSSPVSTVSIGTSGKERTLTNVAAGRLSPVSTDAINGSQLFAVTSEVEKGNLFAGNTGTFNRRLGETTTIRGGLAEDAAASNKNVRTVAKDGQVDILLADNLNVTSVKTGDTLLSTDGLHITGGPSVTTGGINAGNRVISNVGDAVNDTDAVNKRQLDNLSTTVSRGWSIQANGGDTETVAPGDTVNVAQGDNIEVTRAGKTLNIATSRKVNFDNVAIGAITLDKDSGKISGLADGALAPDSRDAVTGSQLFSTNKNVSTNSQNIAANKAQIDSGLNFAGNTGTFNRHLGETTTIRGGLAEDAA